MYNYQPFNAMLVAAIGLAALLLKILFTYYKYTLIEIGNLKPPYSLTLIELRKNVPFLLGTDLRARGKAAISAVKIFSKTQETRILQELAASFRKYLVLLAVGFAVMTVGVANANGNPAYIMLSAFLALLIGLWGIFK
jgi:hypothetical protein